MKHVSCGRVLVKDKFNNKYSVYLDDPRLKSGELIHNTIDMTTVKDKDGNILVVNVNDERLKSGELSGIMKNTIKVVDMYGNTCTINKEDIRIKSGELKKVYHVPIIIIDDITYKNWNHASKELNLPRKEIMKRCYSQIEYFNYIVLPRK